MNKLTTITTLPQSRKDIEKPLLEILTDGRTYKRQELIEKLAIHFDLTQAERNERTPSGGNRFTTRCGYAIHELKIKGRIESPQHGYWKIKRVDVVKSTPTPW